MRLLLALLLSLTAAQAQKRLVLIDEDGSGPGGTNQMGMMALLQSPQVEVLGIAIVTGDGWRDEEVQHTLRMLESIGRTDVPVVPGAVAPLVRTRDETRLAMQRAGKSPWMGAWARPPEAPREGPPHTKPLDEDAAHFLIRQVHAHPGQVAIYTGGPLTDIALAVSIDPHFAELTQGIFLMGGGLSAQSEDEFNFWFDPEAAHIVLRANWPRIEVTTRDVSVKAMFTQQMVDEISKSRSPAAQYVGKYSQERTYMWDEITACAWLDPGIITKESIVYMDVDLSHGPRYGYTLISTGQTRPDVRPVHAQADLDVAKFTKMFVDLMSR